MENSEDYKGAELRCAAANNRYSEMSDRPPETPESDLVVAPPHIPETRHSPYLSTGLSPDITERRVLTLSCCEMTCSKSDRVDVQVSIASRLHAFGVMSIASSYCDIDYCRDYDTLVYSNLIQLWII